MSALSEAVNAAREAADRFDSAHADHNPMYALECAADMEAAIRGIVAAWDPVAPKPTAGDLCRLVGGFNVEHYRCDDYADGTVTNLGKVTKPAPKGAPRGFQR